MNCTLPTIIIYHPPSAQWRGGVSSASSSAMSLSLYHRLTYQLLTTIITHAVSSGITPSSSLCCCYYYPLPTTHAAYRWHQHHQYTITITTTQTPHHRHHRHHHHHQYTAATTILHHLCLRCRCGTTQVPLTCQLRLAHSASPFTLYTLARNLKTCLLLGRDLCACHVAFCATTQLPPTTSFSQGHCTYHLPPPKPCVVRNNINPKTAI